MDCSFLVVGIRRTYPVVDRFNRPTPENSAATFAVMTPGGAQRFRASMVPNGWSRSDRGVASQMSEQAQRVTAEELDAVSFRAVLDAMSRAVIVTSRRGDILVWNAAAQELYGWSEHEVMGRDALELLVAEELRPRAVAIMADLASGREWRGDFVVRRRDGASVRVEAVGRPIFSNDGTVLATVSISEDVTDRRRLERQSAEVTERLELALDAGEFGTWRWDLASGAVVWDARLEALYGLVPGSFDGTFEAYRASLHPDDADAVLAAVEDAIANRSRYTVHHRIIWPDGSVHWLQGRGQVIEDDEGTVTGTIGCVVDVTEQLLAAEERERSVEAALAAVAEERLSTERLLFMARVNEVLAGAATAEDVMRSVARVAVPMLGEWCGVFVLPENGSAIPNVAIAHEDPAMEEYVRALGNRFRYDPDFPTGVPYVIRTGLSEFLPEIDEEMIEQADATDEARDVVRNLRLHSSMAVPMLKRGRVIGAIQLVNTDASRVYTDRDLVLAEAVASRVASTLENRRLAAHQREIATTLQASLLPDALPDIEGLDVTVRYWAAGEGTEVGGDFYDAFAVGDHWAVVIGDVCGTGPQAAAMTGLARHTIRAAAWAGASPSGVLEQLNHAVRRSDRSTFCTAVFCELFRTGIGFHLTVTAGGHPLPILRASDGRTHSVGEPGSLIGVLDALELTTTVHDLAPEDAVILYTDGVTDLPPPFGLDVEDMHRIVARGGQRRRIGGRGRAPLRRRDRGHAAVERAQRRHRPSGPARRLRPPPPRRPRSGHASWPAVIPCTSDIRRSGSAARPAAPSPARTSTMNAT